jgi:alkylated DNA nucleotide flippase Atl1
LKKEGTRRGPSPFAERVLALVDQVPRGNVVTYGDVARLLGTSAPRGVGQVLARWGADVPWWRVVCADGTPPHPHASEALRQLARERVPLLPGRSAVDLSRARWKGPSETCTRRGPRGTS